MYDEDWPKLKETDPSGKPASEPGAKLDSGKAPIVSFVLQYFPDALAAVAWVSEDGAEKYSPFGWKLVENGVVRYANAEGRHLCEANLVHKAQAAWNALAGLQLAIEIYAEGAGKTTMMGVLRKEIQNEILGLGPAWGSKEDDPR